ncbi:hypothetical protein BP6252_05890 [Coleophoma cylindrospora]|uniref:Rhodopsin domain-containing protein n=1 Tax=Coleophoma cylindrospora TaxID=1849047 RepID=A0A3D8RUU0_9HELO|nr:hypothetical protein BP6252_05890 [Coleophoma cylindrospora]
MYAIRDLSPRGYSFLVFNIVAPILVCLAVFLRVWTRLYISKSFGTDDILLLVSTAMYVGTSITGIGISLHGFGSHQDTISPDNLSTQFKYMYIDGILCYLCIIALRFSLCWLFLRFTQVLWQRRVLYSVAIISTIINVFNLFRMNMFYCVPIPYYWEAYAYNNSITGVCVSPAAMSIALYIQYGISVVADWVTCLLPLLLVKDSLMDTKVKILTWCLLGMGIFASGAGIATIIFAPTYMDVDDFTHTAYGLFVAQTTEPFIGILAASFSTYYPLFKSLWATFIGDPGIKMRDLNTIKTIEGLQDSKTESV